MNKPFNIKNAFYAQAVADAVGADFEFGNPDVLRVRRVIHGTSDLEITDDTQMALFGLEGLSDPRNVSRYDGVRAAYVRWYETQTQDWGGSRDISGSARLQAFPQMWQRRAPGNACMRSMGLVATGKYVENDSNGCGTVMRMLPFAVHARHVGLPDATQLAHMCAAITHLGDEIPYTTNIFMKIVDLIQKGESIPLFKVNRITDLGEGWTAKSCLNMAVWAYQNSHTYHELMEHAICHPGDSDSVAAVAGALWGIAGREVPQVLIDRLVEKDAIDYCVQQYEEYHGG